MLDTNSGQYLREGSTYDYSNKYQMFKYNKNKYLLKKDNKYNILLNDKLIGDWFELKDHDRVLKIAKLNEKQNLLKPNGSFVFKEWVDNIHIPFNCNYYIVTKNNMKNFVDGNGKILLRKWAGEVGHFNIGAAPVMYGDDWYIYANGIVDKTSFDNIIDYSSHVVVGIKNNKAVFYLTNSIKIAEFDEINSILKNGYIVKKDGKYNLVNTLGKTFLRHWYETIIIQGNIIIGYINNEPRCYDSDGTILEHHTIKLKDNTSITAVLYNDEIVVLDHIPYIKLKDLKNPLVDNILKQFKEEFKELKKLPF